MSFGKLCVVFLALLKSVLCQTHITVNTNLGQIVGIESQFEGERVFTFYSVPYAEPPERFKKPKPVQPWSTQRSAVTHGKLCVQTISKEITQILPNSEVSEDCLYVDLYIPKSISTENKKAVVIFIPSSNDFEVAFTTAYPLKYLAAEGDIILVIVSFRVDVFGFISTDDDIIPGNYGLWDQQLAITWVNDNIAAFGGDPSRITLMGVMTGAMSVGFQASYPMNKGKFQRISAFMAFSNSRECLVHNAKSFAKKIAKSLCPHQNGTLGSRQIYDCLVVKSAAELIQASANVLSQSPPSIGYPLGPVVDNDFILHEGHGNHTLSVDMYVSMSRYEGYHALFEMAPMIELQYGIDIKQGVPKSVLCHFIIEKIFNQYYQNTANSNFRNLICDLYTRADYTEQSIAAVELLGDAIYFSPVITALNKHAVESAKKNRFLSLVSSESKLVSSKFPWLGNAISGSSFVFLLLKDFVVSYGLQYPQEVIATSVKLVFYWSNFVKTGNPNPSPTDGSSTHWPVYTVINKSYMHFNEDYSTQVEERMFNQRMQFWMENDWNFSAIYPITTISERTSDNIVVTVNDNVNNSVVLSAITEPEISTNEAQNNQNTAGTNRIGNPVLFILLQLVATLCVNILFQSPSERSLRRT